MPLKSSLILVPMVCVSIALAGCTATTTDDPAPQESDEQEAQTQGPDAKKPELEETKLTPAAIWTYTTGNKTASDDWKSSGN